MLLPPNDSGVLKPAVRRVAQQPAARLTPTNPFPEATTVFLFGHDMLTAATRSGERQRCYRTAPSPCPRQTRTIGKSLTSAHPANFGRLGGNRLTANSRLADRSRITATSTDTHHSHQRETCGWHRSRAATCWRGRVTSSACSGWIALAGTPPRADIKCHRAHQPCLGLISPCGLFRMRAATVLNSRPGG